MLNGLAAKAALVGLAVEHSALQHVAALAFERFDAVVGDALSVVTFASLEEVWTDGTVYAAKLRSADLTQRIDIETRAAIFHASDCERLGHVEIA